MTDNNGDELNGLTQTPQGSTIHSLIRGLHSLLSAGTPAAG